MKRVVSLLSLVLFVSVCSWGQNHCMGVNPQMCTNYLVSDSNPVSSYQYTVITHLEITHEN